MLFSECFSDICFLVGNPAKRIYAHSYILAVGSSVFYSMFEGNVPKSPEISITDIEPEPFCLLLKYLYTDEVAINADTAVSVLYAAKKYSVVHLLDACVNFLEKSLDTDNVCTLLSQSRVFDEENLTERCLDFIDNSAEIVLQTESFLKLNRENLSLILGRDSLTVPDEMVVFDAVMKWAEDELCRTKLEKPFLDKRSAIGDVFFQIRFPTMKAEDFAKRSATQADLFSEEEISEIVMYQLADRPLKKFNSNKRNFVTTQKCIRFTMWQTIQVFRQNDCFNVQFCVTKPIVINGYGIFSCCSSTDGGTYLRITIKLLDNNNQVLASISKRLSSNANGTIIPVYFAEGVNIVANMCDVACLVFDSDASSFQYGTVGNMEITQAANNVTFLFHNYRNLTHYKVIGNGQIPQILFCS